MQIQDFDKEKIWNNIISNHNFPKKDNKKSNKLRFIFWFLLFLLFTLSFGIIFDTNNADQIIMKDKTNQTQAKSGVHANMAKATFKNQEKTIFSNDLLCTEIKEQEKLSDTNIFSPSQIRTSQNRSKYDDSNLRYLREKKSENTFHPAKKSNSLNSHDSPINMIDSAYTKYTMDHLVPSLLSSPSAAEDVTENQTVTKTSIDEQNIAKELMLELGSETKNKMSIERKLLTLNYLKIRSTNLFTSPLKLTLPKIVILSKPNFKKFNVYAQMGVGTFNTTTSFSDAEIDTTQIARFNKAIKSYHAQIGSILYFNKMFLKLGLSYQSFEHNGFYQSDTINYINDIITNRIDKVKIVTDYTLFQYYTNLGAVITLGYQFDLGYIHLSPQVGLQYHLIDFSKGSLLSNDHLSLLNNNDLSLDNKLGFNYSLNVSGPPFGRMIPYLEIGGGTSVGYNQTTFKYKHLIKGINVNFGAVIRL